MRSRQGQVALFLVFAIVALFIVVLMNVDIFVAVRAKNRVQNAGDAATLAAARVQGRLLNEIGRLNFDHLLAAVENDAEMCKSIELEQRRLALLGPLKAIEEASKAAMLNGMEVRDDFSEILRSHVDDIRKVYNGGSNGEGEPYPESWPGCWKEYADKLEEAISGGVAAGPDNILFYNSLGGHLLLTREFYFAISGRDWCWFHWNCENVLNSYSNYRDWSPLPTRSENSMENCEIFPLHVVARKGALTEVFTTNEIVELSEKYSETPITAEELARSTLVTNKDSTWFFFDRSYWRKWYEISPDEANDDGGNFPVVGKVKREYDTLGCAAACRCISDIEPVATEYGTDVNWVAAAKPFGAPEIDDAEDDDDITATAHKAFVVPVFTSVRLVPLDSIAGGSLATADADWVEHVRYHLGSYLATGPISRNCFWCRQLVTWEQLSFRQAGIIWLKFHSHECVRPSGGGSSHGGTSHGH